MPNQEEWALVSRGRAFVLRGGNVVRPDGRTDPADIWISNGTVTAVGDRADQPEARVLDATGLVVAPGLIDLQLDGAYGHDFLADPSSIWDVGSRLPETGVTAFLPTIISSPPAAVEEAQRVLDQGPPTDYHGAIPLGLHLEGPMLAAPRAGAHRKVHLRDPDEAIVSTWDPDAHVRMVTLAPELPGAASIIRELTTRGVLVSAGHSEASYDEATESFGAGVSLGTHLFNAMPGLHHRDPGLVGALLTKHGPPVSMIVDGLHVHPSMIDMVWRLKGQDGFVLITDSISVMGLGWGTFEIEGEPIQVDDSGPRTDSGVLVGSTLTMIQAVKNLASFTGCSLVEALAAGSQTPARALGDPSRGQLTVGARADLILLDDHSNVVTTLVAGRPVFAPTHRAPSPRTSPGT